MTGPSGAGHARLVHEAQTIAKGGPNQTGTPGPVQAGIANGDLCEVSPKPDYKGRTVLRVKDLKEPDPRIGVVVGDVVHNLRSALDHVVYQLSIPPTGGVPPIRTEFPIFKSGVAFRGRTDKRGNLTPGSGRFKIRGVRRGAKTVVESLQPYHRRKHPETWTLWMLQELSNFDKHNLLHVAAVAVGGARLSVSGSDFGRLGFQGVSIAHGTLKKNAGLVRINSPVGPEVKVQVDFATGVVFDESKLARSVSGEPVVETLRRIGTFINDEAFPRLERFF